MKKKITLLVAAISVLCVGGAFAGYYGNIDCPRCDYSAMWQGEDEYENGHTFSLYECLQGHRFWVRQD